MECNEPLAALESVTSKTSVQHDRWLTSDWCTFHILTEAHRFFTPRVVQVLMFDEEHISWQTSPEKLLPNNDQSFFRLETMRFTRFALGKIISGLAPDCAPSAIDISPPRWRFTSERDGEGLEVTVYNVLETGTSLMLVAVPVVMPANFPPALEQRRQPRVLYSEGFSSTRSARVPAGGNTKLAAGRSDADEVRRLKTRCRVRVHAVESVESSPAP